MVGQSRELQLPVLRIADFFYACNVTVTNRADAPWIHAFGEDDGLYSGNVTATNRSDGRG
ncbi:MAG: hypothetical protein M3Z30_03330 [Gemmatimonadota bacterium]|nr:hypothetical protein [Gemmatimonadota bacterium]